MTGPATALLKRSPRRDRFHLTFVVLMTVLIVSRFAALSWNLSSRGDPSACASLTRAWRIVAAGESPQDPLRPHLDAWLKAAVMRVATSPAVSGPESLPAPHDLATTRLIIGLIGAIAWIVASFYTYIIVRDRTDERPALVALAVMTLAPGPLANGAEGSTAPLAGLLVLFCLTRAMAILSRGHRKDYIFGGASAALACGFGYHGVLLLFPLLYAHIRSQGRTDSVVADLEWHGRGFLLTAVFLAASILLNPHLWEPFISNVVDAPQLIPGRIRLAVHPVNIVAANDLDARPALLFPRRPAPTFLASRSWIFDHLLPSARGAASSVGYLPLLMGLALGWRSLWQRDLRRWRPVALYAYVAIIARIVSGQPGPGTATSLVPPVAILCAIGFLGTLLRTRFHHQRTAYGIVAVLLLLEPLAAIVATPVSTRTSTDRVAETAALVHARSIPPHPDGGTVVIALGSAIAGTTLDSWPTRDPQSWQLPDIWSSWIQQTPTSLDGLLPAGAARAILIVDPLALTFLAAQAKHDSPAEEAARLNELKDSLLKLPEVSRSAPSADGSIVGPTLHIVVLEP